MTRVTIRRKGSLITGFACLGHAGYAESGSDIVCAAISALTTACVNALESVAGIKPEVEISQDGMVVTLTKPDCHDAQVILRAMLQGLTDVADTYPEHLTVIP